MTTTLSVTPGQVNPPPPPTPDAVAHRGQVRGLWNELMRIADDDHRRDFRYSESNGLHSQPVMLRRCIRPFIASVDADLNAVLQPNIDAALTELHGEDMLDHSAGLGGALEQVVASTSWRAQCEEGALRSRLLSLRLTASSRRNGWTRPRSMLAAQCDCCGAKQGLISAGASVHQLDSGGRAALHMTCLHNCEGAVKLLLRYNACMTLLCDEGLSPFDVVIIAVLNRRESNGFYPQGRRGWLVLMRHRFAHDLVATASSSPPRSCVESAFSGKTATPSKTKEDANDGGCELPGDGDINSAGASPKGTAPSEAFEGRTSQHSLCKCQWWSVPNGGGKVQVCHVLRGAVEWLVQCPDEVGVFSETSAFL
ncbi:unnamed protein product [Ectocarpus sp. CCAP 1310/34]|nr:unnamed protein product [Ectocarpus sp. CCAP 1310/34]